MQNEEPKLPSGEEGAEEVKKETDKPLTAEEAAALRDLYKVIDNKESVLNIPEEEAGINLNRALSELDSYDFGPEKGTGPIPGDEEIITKFGDFLESGEEGEELSPEEIDRLTEAFLRDPEIASVLDGIDYSAPGTPKTIAEQDAEADAEWEAHRSTYEKAMRAAGRTDEYIDPTLDKLLAKIRAGNQAKEISDKLRGKTGE